MARSALDSFEEKCIRAKTPLQPSFADQVRAAWKMVNAAQTALEDAQSGTTSSIHTVSAFTFLSWSFRPRVTNESGYSCWLTLTDATTASFKNSISMPRK